MTTGAGLANFAVEPAAGISIQLSAPAFEVPTRRPSILAKTSASAGTLAALVATLNLPSAPTVTSRTVSGVSPTKRATFWPANAGRKPVIVALAPLVATFSSALQVCTALK